MVWDRGIVIPGIFQDEEVDEHKRRKKRLFPVTSINSCTQEVEHTRGCRIDPSLTRVLVSWDRTPGSSIILATSAIPRLLFESAPPPEAEGTSLLRACTLPAIALAVHPAW